MSSNRSYHKSPLYFPDDKDIKDFLESTNPPVRKLRNFLATKGIFPSKGLSKEAIHDRVSNLLFGWKQLSELVEIVDLGEKWEKNTFSNVDFKGDFQLVSDAFEAVKEGRQLKNKERYKITRRDSKLEVEVDYLQIDSSRTPMLQGQPAKLYIEIEASDGGLRVTHTSNDTARKVMECFHGELGELHKDESGEHIEIPTSNLTLKEILNPKLRVQFFTSMAKGIDGYEYVAATNVKVARFPKTENDEEPDKSGFDPEEEEQHIKNVILSGIDVEHSRHYDQLLDAGFFVGSLTWECTQLSTSDRISFTAGFRKAEEGIGFEFKVNHRILYEDGDYSTREPIKPMMMADMRNRLCESALDALDEIVELAEKNDPGPAKEE